MLLLFVALPALVVNVIAIKVEQNPHNTYSRMSICENAVNQKVEYEKLSESNKDGCNDEKDKLRQKFRDLLLKEADYDPTGLNATRKRADYLSWDDYFMSVAYLSAQRSKDPLQQVGACIVDADNRVVGIGYNGFPQGCNDDYLPWESSCSEKGMNLLHTKDPFMCHAEVNAILNKCSSDVKGARMFVVQYPNNECAKIIIQSGIREVIYHKGYNATQETYRASRIMFEMSGVNTIQFESTKEKVILDFGENLDEEESSPEQKSSLSGSDEIEYRENMKKLLLKEAGYNVDAPTRLKRSSYLSWDDYFMAISFLSAKRSKDPSTQVGACIVNKENRIVGIGYNGFPRDCSDECLPWARTGLSSLHTKYPFVCHAEVNAILNKCSADVVGSSLYVALFPCNDCAKMIIQAGIREIVYLSDKYHDTEQTRASRIMFAMAGVKLRYYRPKKRYLTINLERKEK